MAYRIISKYGTAPALTSSFKMYLPNNPTFEAFRLYYASKEPETTEWIEGFSGRCVFWDVGAIVRRFCEFDCQCLRLIHDSPLLVT